MIRGEVRVAGTSLHAETAPVRNPARTIEVVGEVALGTAAHVDAAVAAAHDAFPRWAALPAAARAELCPAALNAWRPHVAELSELLTREQGKVLWEAKSDVGGATGILQYYADQAGYVAADTIFRKDERGTVWTGRRPTGVTAVIVPWNSPVYLGFLAIAPALIAGNTVVVKPPEQTPLTLSETVRLVAEKLPPGVLNCVPGGGGPGAALARHELVRKVLFTGSTATGQEIMRAAAGNLKNLSLELGGNDPAIVLGSAVPGPRLIEELVRGVYALSGQVCFAIKRIYVQRSHYRDVLDGFLAAADRIVVGDGLRPEVTMGPVNNRAQYERVRTLMERTREAGATVREAGRKDDPAGWDDGYFFRPAVVTEISPDAELVVSEQFGPIVPVIPFDSDDEAVRLANGTDYGLAASVWTDDEAHGLAVAQRIQAGSVFLNTHRAGASDVSMPFGGVKRSGIGRLHGVAALDACTEFQTIASYTDVSSFPGPPPATTERDE